MFPAQIIPLFFPNKKPFPQKFRAEGYVIVKHFHVDKAAYFSEILLQR